MKAKSIITISMALVLSISLMAGCTKKPATDSSSTPPSSTAPSSEAPKKAESGQLNTVYETVVKEVFGEEAPSFMLSEDKAQLKEMTGMDMSSDAVKEFIYAAPMMNVQFQILAGIEANEGKVADAEKILTDYQARVLADKEAFPYVDFGLEKAKGAKVITIDDYVFYVCMANPDIDAEDGQKAVDEAIAKTVKTIEDTLKK